jgi:hypothetical protein
VTVIGFKKCHISNAMDETDDILWIGSEEGGEVKGGFTHTMPFC